MAFSGLSGLSAVPAGYNAGIQARQQNDMDALRIKQAQMQLEQYQREQAAQGIAFGGMAQPVEQQGPAGAPMAQLPQLPMAQQPMPGQASVPMVHPGAGGPAPMGTPMPPINPGMAQPGQPMPSPGGAPPGAGAGMPTALPPGAAPPDPAAPGVPASPFTNATGGGFDIRTVARALKAQNPQADNQTLFAALVQSEKLLNPQAKMELQFLVGQMRQEMKERELASRLEIAQQRIEAQKENYANLAQLKTQLAEMQIAARGTRLEQTMAAAMDRLDRTLAAAQQRTETTVAGAQQRTDTTTQAASERQQATAAAAQQRTDTQQAGAAARTQAQQEGANQRVGAKIDVKNEPVRQAMTDAATEARAIAEAIKKDPTLVGLAGQARRTVGGLASQAQAVGVLPKGTGSDLAATDLKARVTALQERIRRDMVGSRYFSKNSQQRYDTLAPGLGAFDDPDKVIRALTRLAEDFDRDAANIPKAPAAANSGENRQNPPKSAAPAAPAAAAAPTRPRAKNPTTGETLEYDGKAWVPVAQ